MSDRNDLNNPAHADDSAAKRAHGTHGKGDGREERIDDAAVEPGDAEGQQRGSAGWGSEQSGGSVTDKRSDKDRG